MIDLHLHSTASDGLLSPEALVQAAKREQLTTIALIDHDTLSGISRAASEAATCGVELLTGVEISIAFLAYRDVHLLGYGMIRTTVYSMKPLSSSLKPVRNAAPPSSIGSTNPCAQKDGYHSTRWKCSHRPRVYWDVPISAGP
jgi:hypothetical protein